MTNISFALRELDTEDGDETKFHNNMSTHLIEFSRALQQYSPVLVHFQQMAANVHQAAWNSGSTIGELAGGIFGGGLTGILTATAGSYIAGNSIDRELQAEGERLQQAFHVMLQAYDQTMSDLRQYAFGLFNFQERELTVAVRNARG